MNYRRLTVTPYGDFWRDRIKSRIRLEGKWLREAGFEPGYKVTVRVTPGEITLFVEKETENDDKLRPVPPAQDKSATRRDRRYDL